MTSPLLAPAAHLSRVRFALALAGIAALAPAACHADAAPAEAVTPAADGSYGPIRPLVGALLTGTIAGDPEGVANPDGSDASGVLGERVQVLAGAEFQLAANGLALRLTGGVQTGNLSGAHGSEHFRRFPLEASLLYPLDDRLRIGAGIRYAARIRFSGPGGNTSDGLSATPSLIAMVDYRLFDHLLLDVRYVYERFETANGDLEGSHFGIGATARY